MSSATLLGLAGAGVAEAGGAERAPRCAVSPPWPAGAGFPLRPGELASGCQESSPTASAGRDRVPCLPEAQGTPRPGSPAPGSGLFQRLPGASRSPGAARGATAHRSSPGCSARSPRSRVFPALDGSDHVVILGHCWERSLFLVCFMRILCRVFFLFLNSVVFSLPASSPAWWNHAVLRLFLLAFRLLSRSGVSVEAEGGACSALDPGPHP